MSIVEKALRKIHAGQSSIPVVADRDKPTAQPVERVPAPSLAAQPARTLTIDFDALRRSGMCPAESQERQFAAEYRAIKRPLLRAALETAAPGGRPGNLIMVASALAGEGKTFTAVNLALSLALDRDHSVVLVDVDVAKPHVSRLFGVEHEPGLLDVLEDPARSLESVMLPTSVPGLQLLPVGKNSERSAELVSSNRMREVLNQAAALHPNRIIVMDSSPVLLTTESRALAAIAGQLVLIVHAGSTPQFAVQESIEILKEGGATVSLVLNQADARTNYYNGYGSGAYGTVARSSDA